MFVLAQHVQNISIKGIITDNNGEPIPYTTIRLLDSKNNNLIIGGITDDNGLFNLKFEQSDTGNYKLIISFVGFSSKTIELNITKNKSTYDFKKIVLKQSEIKLNEAVVSAERKKFESFVNKDVVIPDSSMVKSSINTIDLLGKVPQLKVDKINNSVTILGSENVLVLVNGIEKKGRSDIKTIPPEDIDKIEIITNPSAKYDSEYTGVINIILKKKIKQGFTCDLELSYWGLRHSEPYVSLTYGFEKIRLFVDYDFYLRNHEMKSYEWRSSVLNSKEYTYINNLKSDNSISNPSEFGHMFKYGADYFINNNNTLNFTGNYSLINDNKGYIADTKTYINDTLSDNLVSNFVRKGNYLMQNYSFFYKKDFHNPENKLTSDINFYKMSFNTGTTRNDNYLNNIQDNIVIRNISRFEDKYSVNLKIDYNQIIVKNINFESGYNLYTWNYTNSTIENNVSDKFLYHEIRNAGYLNLYWKINELQFISGIRAENTDILINNSINDNYLNFVPMFGIKYQDKKNNNFRLNYKRSLSRPNLFDLNPYYYQQDSLNYRQGNPYLKPAKFDYLEFNFSHNKDGFYLSPSIYFRKGHYIFANQITQIGNIRYVKNENIAQSQKMGLKINSSILFFKFIKLNPFFEVNYSQITDNLIINDGYSYTFSLSTEITVLKKITFDFDLTLPGKNYYLQGYTKNKFTLSYISVSKSILKDNGGISIGITDPFKSMTTYTYEKFDNNKMNNNNYIDFRMFFIKFSYSFTRGKELNALKRQYNMEKDK